MIVWDKTNDSTIYTIGSEFELLWSKQKHRQEIIKTRDIVTGKLVKTAERTESLDLSKETLKIKEFLKKERKQQQRNNKHKADKST